jgi:hypothetical protein
MSRRPDSATLAATLCAAAMIASQVGGKATRDALFLSSFPVTALPTALVASSLLSIVAALLAARTLATHGPMRLVPPAFAASAALLGVEWGLSRPLPKVAAVALYLHMALIGAILISWFWSIVNELFDPRTAKRRIGGIAAGGALGGLVGGVVAERVGAHAPIAAMLPILAGLQLVCAATLGALPRGARAAGAGATPPRAATGAGRIDWSALHRLPYVRDIAVLVAIVTLCAALVDYVFKAQVVATFRDGSDLVRFFAAFHTGVAFLTFAVQALLSRVSLERLGLANTAAMLPLAVAGGGLAAFAAPGLASIVTARAAEAVLRSSLFRSGYEVLFTPIPPREKRATKTVVDVGSERLGDAAGGALVALVLFAAPDGARTVLLALAVALALAGLWMARRLHGGYVRALERSLRTHAVDLDLSDAEDMTTRTTMMRTLTGLAPLQPPAATAASPAPAPAASRPPAPAASAGAGMHAGVFPRPMLEGLSRAPSAPAARAAPAAPADPIARTIAALRGSDAAQLRATLRALDPLDAHAASHVIALLERDDVAADATNALRRAAPRIAGQLLDALLDAGRPFAVRRRVPRIVSACATRRVADGLVEGLADTRFEVRFQCGLGLSRIRRADAKLAFDADAVFAAVRREVAVGRSVWEGQRLLDRLEDDDASPFVEAFLKDRASRSLEHVFTLLSLVLPEEPLRIAFRGLHTDDQNLRGTALEYLESVLPAVIRESLWPFLEDSPGRRGKGQTREEILESLMRSNASIQINLEELRKRSSGR